MRTRLAVALSLVLLDFGCSSDGDEPPAHPDASLLDASLPSYHGAIDYVATHYDVALDLSTRQSTVDVTLHTKTDGDCVSIGMRTMSAEAVSLAGAPAQDVRLEQGKLHACDGAGHGFAAGSDVVLQVKTTLPLKDEQQKLDVGLSTKMDQAGGTFTYLVSWLNGCDLHGPCDARADAFATYRFVVTHDEQTQVLCPGQLTEKPTQTICDFHYDGGPSYSTYGLMARSPAWTKVPLGTWNGVNVTLYDRPHTVIGQQLDAAQIAGQFAWMIGEFGAFPYGDELRFVVAPTYWAGFEHPGNIALADYLGTYQSAYADGIQHTTMHELVHMWAGDQATLAGTYDFVWKEAMAEYLTYVYEDEVLGATVSNATVSYWKRVSTGSKYYPVPEDQPRPALATYYGDAYGPGPMILFRQMEATYGRETVLAAIQSLIGTGAPRALGITDVQAALEQATGKDLQKYFDAWVYGGGKPAYPVATAVPEEVSPGSWTVRVATTTMDGVARGCAFHVRLEGARADEHAEFLVDNMPDGGEYDTPTAQALAFTPVKTVIDPDNECLVYTPATLYEPPPRRFW
jgi:aminopeptidase N